jgi:hypothetical protein
VAGLVDGGEAEVVNVGKDRGWAGSPTASRFLADAASRASRNDPFRKDRALAGVRPEQSECLPQGPNPG